MLPVVGTGYRVLSTGCWVPGVGYMQRSTRFGSQGERCCWKASWPNPFPGFFLIAAPHPHPSVSGAPQLHQICLGFRTQGGPVRQKSLSVADEIGGSEKKPRAQAREGGARWVIGNPFRERRETL